MQTRGLKCAQLVLKICWKIVGKKWWTTERVFGDIVDIAGCVEGNIERRTSKGRFILSEAAYSSSLLPLSSTIHHRHIQLDILVLLCSRWEINALAYARNSNQFSISPSRARRREGGIGKWRREQIRCWNTNSSFYDNCALRISHGERETSRVASDFFFFFFYISFVNKILTRLLYN